MLHVCELGGEAFEVQLDIGAAVTDEMEMTESVLAPPDTPLPGSRRVVPMPFCESAVIGVPVCRTCLWALKTSLSSATRRWPLATADPKTGSSNTLAANGANRLMPLKRRFCLIPSILSITVKQYVQRSTWIN